MADGALHMPAKTCRWYQSTKINPHGQGGLKGPASWACDKWAPYNSQRIKSQADTSHHYRTRRGLAARPNL